MTTLVIFTLQWPWEVAYLQFLDSQVLRGLVNSYKRWNILWKSPLFLGVGQVFACSCGEFAQFIHPLGDRRADTLALLKEKPYIDGSVLHSVPSGFLSYTVTRLSLKYELVLMVTHWLLCWPTVDMSAFLSALCFWLSNSHSRELGTSVF